jgi:hypothetical protein
MSAIVSKKLKFKGGERKADRAASPKASTDKLRFVIFIRKTQEEEEISQGGG